jgi:hypothetical protein
MLDNDTIFLSAIAFVLLFYTCLVGFIIVKTKIRRLDAISLSSMSVVWLSYLSRTINLILYANKPGNKDLEFEDTIKYY